MDDHRLQLSPSWSHRMFISFTLRAHYWHSIQRGHFADVSEDFSASILSRINPIPVPRYAKQCPRQHEKNALVFGGCSPLEPGFSCRLCIASFSEHHKQSRQDLETCSACQIERARKWGVELKWTSTHTHTLTHSKYGNNVIISLSTQTSNRENLNKIVSCSLSLSLHFSYGGLLAWKAPYMLLHEGALHWMIYSEVNCC